MSYHRHLVTESVTDRKSDTQISDTNYRIPATVGIQIAEIDFHGANFFWRGRKKILGGRCKDFLGVHNPPPPPPPHLTLSKSVPGN